MPHVAEFGKHTTTSVDVKYEIPIEAVTEIIVNACTHRSYESNGSVQVELYPDRIEVWNPGQLPLGLTPASLSVQHKSLPTNPVLAHPVYLAGYIERIGTGTTDVIESCMASGLKELVFEQDVDFKVTLWRKNSNDGMNALIDPEMIQSDPDVFQSDPDEERLKSLLKANPQLSRAKLSKELKISERQVRKIIDRLCLQGKLLRVGSDTNGRWIFPKGD